MTELEEIIHAEIRQDGPMRFDRFMELALYEPGHGYYVQSGRAGHIGRQGDFFTSVSVGPLFGKLLARQFFQMWQLMERPTPFWVIEQGANDGQLARDILGWCRSERPAFFEAIHYAIVESPGFAHQQRRRLGKAGGPGIKARLTEYAGMASLATEKPVGVFFSNELTDAFPVRVIRFQSGQWRERYVIVSNGDLDWADLATMDKELLQAISGLPLPNIEGYTTEVNLRARCWMRDLGATLERGYVLTLDYGFPASVYYADFRMGGTLTAYRHHRRTDEVLAAPGTRDITAHVDFTALAQAGEKGGLITLGFTEQQRFLMGVAHDELKGTEGPRVGIANDLRAWNTLTHPEYLGTRFHALLQAKNAPRTLDGLRFARPGGL
ncbi:MAG TPA: SAM-dependent methyltransferase [Candidatus Methylacidiphilales bacterium]|nr:SAM-dependent methyltransferase [Candidatus Methylacidiphilales bacterium]